MERSRRNRVLATVAALALGGFPATSYAANTADTLASDRRFNKIVDLIQRAGLTDSLKSASQVTIFAPTDAAFERIPPTVISDLAPPGGNREPNEQPDKLQALVRIHLLANAYAPSTFVGQRVTVTDEAGTSLVVDGSKSGEITITTVPRNVGGPNIGGMTTPRTAQVVGTPIATDNGVIYPIDNVLIQ